MVVQILLEDGQEMVVQVVIMAKLVELLWLSLVQ